MLGDRPPVHVLLGSVEPLRDRAWGRQGRWASVPPAAPLPGCCEASGPASELLHAILGHHGPRVMRTSDHRLHPRTPGAK